MERRARAPEFPGLDAVVVQLVVPCRNGAAGAGIRPSFMGEAHLSPGGRKDAPRSSRRAAYAAAFRGKAACAGGKSPHRAGKHSGAKAETGDRTSAGGRQAIQSTEER